jgi:hypothetical protein
VTLKLNWIFLLCYVFAEDFYVSGIIFSHCLLATLLLNFLLFRIPFRNHNLLFDPSFSPYRLRYPRLLTFLLYLSSTFSFHLFRLTFSKLLGLRSLSASFTNQALVTRLLNQTSIINIILVVLPGAAGCIYNLYYATYLSQLWYFDIDGLILVGMEITMTVLMGCQRIKISTIIEDFKISTQTDEMLVAP